jgi:hypothetical protein
MDRAGGVLHQKPSKGPHRVRLSGRSKQTAVQAYPRLAHASYSLPLGRQLHPKNPVSVEPNTGGIILSYLLSYRAARSTQGCFSKLHTGLCVFPFTSRGELVVSWWGVSDVGVTITVTNVRGWRRRHLR